MGEVVLYTIHCANCKVLEMKLKKKNIDFKVVDDNDAVIQKGIEVGIHSAPILEVDGKFFGFTDAVKFLNRVE